MTPKQGNYAFGLLSAACLIWAGWQSLWGSEGLFLIIAMATSGALGMTFALLVHIWAGGDFVHAIAGSRRGAKRPR